MNYKIFFTTIAVTFSLLSCGKNEIKLFHTHDMVYFYERYMLLGYLESRLDEISYSFAVKSSSLQSDEVNIKVRLQGNIAEYDREVRVEVIPDSTTAVEGVHYKLNVGIIKAGEYEGTIPITVLRAADLKTDVVKLKLKICDSKDLRQGVIEDSFIRVVIGDMLMPPTNWPQYYWGNYSANKYRFAIDFLGITDYPIANRYQTEPKEGIYTTAEIMAFAYQLNNAYAEYRLTNPPIYMDDNAEVKVEISF